MQPLVSQRRRRVRRITLASLPLLAALAMVAHADVCRVTTAGAANTTGTDWHTDAMSLAAALGTPRCGEVWVAAGVYVPGSQSTDAFSIAPGTAVYGGFRGTETVRGQRDPVANPTILSGDIGGDDINADGNQIDESYSDIVGTNARHVVVIDGTGGVPVDMATVLDGFIVTAGGNNGQDGGGLLCKANGSSTARCSPYLHQLSFVGNRAMRGGAVMLDAHGGGAANPTISEVLFRGNSAVSGGGLYSDTDGGGVASPLIRDSSFVDNTAVDIPGPNFQTMGGAVVNRGYDNGVSSPTLINVTFVGNRADHGAAMYNMGEYGESSPHLVNVTFSGNTGALDADAMYNDGYNGICAPVLQNVVMWAGSAAGPGGEVVNRAGATPTTSNAIIAGGCPLGSTCSAVFSADPGFGALGDHGGFVPTLLPAAGGPAIDAGADGACPFSDARGVSRPQGWHCDLGAVERAEVGSIVAQSGSGQQVAIWHTFYDPLLVQVLGPSATPAQGVALHTQVVTSTGAAATCTDARSNGAGLAYIYCRANGDVGSYTVEVRAAGYPQLPPATFLLGNTAGDGDTIFRDSFDPPGPRVE